MRLDSWLHDEQADTFSGKVTGHPNLADGTFVRMHGKPLDGSSFIVGNQTIQLGRSLADEYYEDAGEDWPWPN